MAIVDEYKDLAALKGAGAGMCDSRYQHKLDALRERVEGLADTQFLKDMERPKDATPLDGGELIGSHHGVPIRQVASVDLVLEATDRLLDLASQAASGSFNYAAPQQKGDQGLTHPIWGSDEFKIGGKVIFVSLKDEQDPFWYGRARGVWWRCFPFGSGRVIRVEDPAVLQELEEWFGKREEVEGWYRDQRRGVSEMPAAEPDDFVIKMLLDRASLADGNAVDADAEADRLATASRESLATANKYRVDAAALRAAAERLAG